MTDTFIDTRNPATEQAVIAFGNALSNAFDPDYQAQRATARIKNQLAQAEAQNALGFEQERRAAAQGMPEKFSPDEDVRQRYNERQRLQQEAENTTAQNGMMSQLAQGTPAAESQRSYRALNDLPPAPNVAAAQMAEKGTIFPGFAEEQARTQKQAMGETAQNANVGNLSSDALFSPAMKQRAEDNAQLIAGLENQYKALQLQVSPLNPNQNMRLQAIQQQNALKEKMAAARENQVKIGLDAENEIATVRAKLGSDGFRQKLSTEIGKTVLGFGKSDGNLALIIQDAPDAPPVVWKTQFQANYLDDLVKMGTKTVETNAIGETGNPLKTIATTIPGGDARTTVEGDAEVAGRVQKFTAGITKEVASTNYLNAHTKGVEQQSELHGVQMDLAKEKLNQERLINSGRAKRAGGQLLTPEEDGALMAFEKQQKEPKEDNLKAKDGLQQLQARYGGRLEGGMWFPDEKNKDVAIKAAVAFEKYIGSGMKPMAAAAAAIADAERKSDGWSGAEITPGQASQQVQPTNSGVPEPRATGNELLRQADAAVADAMQIINKPAPGSSGIASPQSARMEELRQFIASGKGSDEDKLNAQMEFLAMKSSNTPAQKNGAKSPSPEQIMQKKVAAQDARIAELSQIIAAPTYIWHKGMVGNPKGAVLEERKLNAQKELRALLGGGGD